MNGKAELDCICFIGSGEVLWQLTRSRGRWVKTSVKRVYQYPYRSLYSPLISCATSSMVGESKALPFPGIAVELSSALWSFTPLWLTKVPLALAMKIAQCLAHVRHTVNICEMNVVYCCTVSLGVLVFCLSLFISQLSPFGLVLTIIGEKLSKITCIIWEVRPTGLGHLGSGILVLWLHTLSFILLFVCYGGSGSWSS